ncbi:hypothetical protein B9K05_08355 [Acetobacter syzygii]|uniref:Uncharacterized protein n=1 Tax=Acetobacter syzygii TaxID=146476 RepID=A0A270BNJ5_9PROT|nr:hypothetical protein B9K05_08355 [Acetobacter syzygii]
MPPLVQHGGDFTPHNHIDLLQTKCSGCRLTPLLACLLCFLTTQAAGTIACRTKTRNALYSKGLKSTQIHDTWLMRAIWLTYMYFSRNGNV